MGDKQRDNDLIARGRELAPPEPERIAERFTEWLVLKNGLTGKVTTEAIKTRLLALLDSRPIAQDGAMLNVIREQIKFNKEYGDACVKSGQQGAAAARFARAEAFTDLLAELEREIPESWPTGEAGAREAVEEMCSSGPLHYLMCEATDDEKIELTAIITKHCADSRHGGDEALTDDKKTPSPFEFQ